MLTADSAIKDLAWSSLVEWTARRLDVATFAQEGQVLQLRAVEVTGNVDVFAAHNNDFLAQQQLLGDNRSKTTQNMALSINDDRFCRKAHLVFYNLKINKKFYNKDELKHEKSTSKGFLLNMRKRRKEKRGKRKSNDIVYDKNFSCRKKSCIQRVNVRKLFGNEFLEEISKCLIVHSWFLLNLKEVAMNFVRSLKWVVLKNLN